MAQKPNKEVKKKEQDISVKIDRMVNFENSSIRAFASANIAGSFAIHGISVFESQNGRFIRMPQQSYIKDGKPTYVDMVHPITAEARKELSDKVLDAYEQELNAIQSESGKFENDIKTDEPAMTM